MTKNIAIGVSLVIIGAIYFWWWNQPIKQMADLGTGGQVPQNWTELGESYPQLCTVFRILKMDPFDRAVEDAAVAARVMSQKVYVTSSRHALGGIVAILAGIALPIGAAIRKRRKKRSEQPLSPGLQAQKDPLKEK